jgi:hypothetical protein
MTKTYTELTYIICHNGADVVHPVKVEPGTTLSSGQPQIEEFADEAAWKARLTELKFDLAKLEPPTPEAMKAPMPGGGPARGRMAGLSIEERKAQRQQRREERLNMANLSPEERKAARQQRLAERMAARNPMNKPS